jgi:hypothetical protein
MNKYYFDFTGSVEIVADSLNDAESKFTAMSATELASHFSVLEVGREDSNGVIDWTGATED